MESLQTLSQSHVTGNRFVLWKDSSGGDVEMV